MSYLQTSGLEILLCLPACIYLSRRTGLFSPASTSANLCLASLIFAFVVSWGKIDLLDIKVTGIAFYVTASEEGNIIASHIYTAVIFLSLISTFGIRKARKKTDPESSQETSTGKKKPLQSSLRIHSILAPLFLIVTLVHFLFALLPNIDHYYFTERYNIPLVPLLLFSFVLCYYSLSLTKKIYFFLYLPCFLYSFTIMLGAYSRMVPLTFAIVTMCIAVDTNIKKPWVRYSASTFCALLSVFFMLYSLAGRSERDAGLDYGLVWDAMKEASNPANSYLILAATSNIFHGVILLAECVDTTGVSYSNVYQILSLSPFPSAIDGWDQVVGDQIRVNYYTPFNTFAEAYFFAPPIQFALIAIYCLCVRTMTRFYMVNTGWRRIAIIALSLFCWAIMQQYPVRNIFRVLLAAAVLCIILRVRRPKPVFRGYLSPRRPLEPVATLATSPSPVAGPLYPSFQSNASGPTTPSASAAELPPGTR